MMWCGYFRKKEKEEKKRFDILPSAQVVFIKFEFRVYVRKKKRKEKKGPR